LRPPARQRVGRRLSASYNTINYITPKKDLENFLRSQSRSFSSSDKMSSNFYLDGTPEEVKNAKVGAR